jgi:hypothetical protein
MRRIKKISLNLAAKKSLSTKNIILRINKKFSVFLCKSDHCAYDMGWNGQLANPQWLKLGRKGSFRMLQVDWLNWNKIMTRI